MYKLTMQVDHESMLIQPSWPIMHLNQVHACDCMHCLHTQVPKVYMYVYSGLHIPILYSSTIVYVTQSVQKFKVQSTV